MKNKIFSSFYLSMLLLLVSCEKNEEPICSGACTEEFRTITVEIIDAEGNPVALDNFMVISLESGEEITKDINKQEFEMMQKYGTYPLFGDEFAKEYRRQKVKINFRGFINNKEVVKADYVVGADCCHVVHFSGDLVLEIP